MKDNFKYTRTGRNIVNVDRHFEMLYRCEINGFLTKKKGGVTLTYYHHDRITTYQGYNLVSRTTYTAFGSFIQKTRIINI